LYISISNQQSPINNHQGGGVDISSFSGKKPGSEGNFRENIGKAKDKDSPPDQDTGSEMK
jgi:hypothetical protein